VEDRAFADAEYLAALEAAETDLIDAWVRGDLSQADSRAFERRFLTSAERLRKVEFAKDLARILAESKAAERAFSARVSGWRSLIQLVRGWNPTLGFATVAAGVMCLSAAVWLIVQNAAMRSHVAALEARRSDLELQVKETHRKLNDEQRRADAFSARLQQQSSAGETPPVIASLTLMPGLVRSESRTQELVLPPAAQIAHIAIQLEARDDYRRFRVELRTRRGDEVVTLGSVPRRRTAAGDTVSFDVAASALAAGEYELALKGAAADQTFVDVGYYYLRVRKQ
jgi:hypothetical protein